MGNVVNEILAMVQNILAYFQEGEAAGVIEIVKTSLSDLFAMIGL